MEINQKDRLKEVLSIPTFVGKEEKMTEYLMDYLTRINVVHYSDEFGNVYATKGISDTYPCVVAHIDTVHKPISFKVYEQNDKLYAMNNHGQKAGIGGDNKAGVFVCLELLRKQKNIKAAFFVSEEVGCLGAYLSDATFFENVGYAIEFDAPYHNWISHFSDGIELFDLNGEFFQTIKPVFEEHIKFDWGMLGYHPYTDVSALKSLYDFTCLNYSVGYHNMHSVNEYVSIDEVEGSLNIAKDLLKALGNKKYEFKQGVVISEGRIEDMKQQIREWKSYEY